MNEMEWMLLDTGLMWSEGIVKQWGVGGNLIMEQEKEEQKGR